jgi:hypothetical protein
VKQSRKENNNPIEVLIITLKITGISATADPREKKKKSTGAEKPRENQGEEEGSRPYPRKQQ